MNSFLYNTCFCIYMMMVIRHALKRSKILKKTFHLVNLCITIGFVIYFLFNDKMGKSALGTCSLKAAATGLKTFIPIGFYLIISIYTIYFIIWSLIMLEISLTQFSPKWGFNPGGGLNLSTLPCMQ